MLGSYESAGQHKSFLFCFFHKASRGPYILRTAVLYNARTNGTTDCSARLVKFPPGENVDGSKESFEKYILTVL